MNKLSFSLRATAVSWWVVCGLSIGLPLSAVAQSATPPIRQADFIVAVVNSEPITNQEVRAISQRLQREAAAQGRPVDEAQARSLALEQLINDKAQLQQARDVGIRIDA
jgi:peptidyl-prolyl cis-trans isomerase SurA